MAVDYINMISKKQDGGWRKPIIKASFRRDFIFILRKMIA